MAAQNMDFRDIQNAVRELPEDIDFPAVLELLTSKHTSHVVDRHIKAVAKICKQCANGFLLKHLQYLVELVEVLGQRWKKGQREWCEAICGVAKIGGKPFSSCATEDLLQYGKWLPSFVTAVISILQDAQPTADNPDPQKDMIRIEIAYMVASIARYGLEDDWVQEGADDSVIQNVAYTGTPSLRLLQQTNVIAEIARVFRIEHSPEALVIMLGALKDMSLFQPLAVQITNCGLLSNLIAVIRNNLLGSDVLLISAEILWNVLELDREHASAALGETNIMESFVVFLTTVLHEGYRYKDKIFRNDMLALLIFILARPDNHDIAAKSGLVCLILKHAAEGPIKDMLISGRIFEEEIESISTVPATIFLPRKLRADSEERKAPIPLTTCLEDMEFRILTWRAVAKTAGTSLCAELIEKFLFVPMLLRYLDVVSLDPFQTQWSPDQRKKLQLEAMRVLFLVVPHCPSSYLESDGNGVVVRLLQTTQDRDLQKACLTLLHRACLASTKADGFEQVDIPPCCMLDASHLDVVDVLLDIFGNRTNPFSLRQLSCSILGCLCRQDEAYSTRFRKAKGVETLAIEVKWNPQGELQDRLFFMLHVVDCVWCAIVGDTLNEEKFLKNAGLFALLDALESAPVMLRRHIMGCIADLVQNPNAASLFVQWNSSKSMKGGLKILLEIWGEEQSIAEAVTKEGVLQNLDFPLNPKHDPLAAPPPPPQEPGVAMEVDGGTAATAATAKAEDLSIHKLQNPASSTKVLDLAAKVDQDSRPKIYAILSKIGFEKNETLTMEERQALELLRLLPECLVLEQLRQVEWNLQDFRLLAQDQKWLDEMISEQRTRTEWIQNVQRQLFEEFQTQEVADLQRYFDDIRNRIQVVGR
ncbi:unnamed protein product [Amoebophrya sp. A25]|nr:unnamed protein product [Amoebophrya sp. A25]|eukprot:GSA25T00025112001.1